MVIFPMTWADTVIGGILVKESRKDPLRGSEDLRYFEWITWSLGGIIPVILGPLVLYQAFEMSVTSEFYVIVLNAFCLMVAALFLPRSQSMEEEMADKQISVAERNRFQVTGVKEALKIKPLRRTLIFYAIVMVGTPTFQVYLGDIYNNNATEDIISESCFCCTLVGITIIYSFFLE